MILNSQFFYFLKYFTLQYGTWFLLHLNVLYTLMPKLFVIILNIYLFIHSLQVFQLVIIRQIKS
jgi:hypothetical protein